jgi:preprotein translocase subunit YajC
MSLAKKLKMIVKGELKPTFGTDPNDPWSARAGITESETSMLGSYLKSRGINPEFVSKDTKISHAKSTEFSKWKRDHNFDDPADYVSSATRDKMKSQREELEIEEAKTTQGTALDKFRQAAAERARKHDDFEREMKARHAAGKEDMKGSIDRLEKQLNKEEIEVNEADLSKMSTDKLKAHWNKHKDQERPAPVFAAQLKRVATELKKRKALGEEHKVGDSVTVNSKFFGKQKGKVTKIDNQSIHVQRNDKKTSEKYPHDAVVKEDVYQDSQAATQTAFDMGTTPNQTEPTYSRRKEMSKSARIIKSLYKYNNMKEEIYDHEKEDKSVATYGKKPKVEKVGIDGDEDNQAAMVLKGGKTLTGQERDTLEIDPVMRKPTNPDIKNSNKKTDK